MAKGRGASNGANARTKAAQASSKSDDDEEESHIQSDHSTSDHGVARICCAFLLGIVLCSGVGVWLLTNGIVHLGTILELAGGLPQLCTEPAQQCRQEAACTTCEDSLLQHRSEILELRQALEEARTAKHDIVSEQNNTKFEQPAMHIASAQEPTNDDINFSQTTGDVLRDLTEIPNSEASYSNDGGDGTIVSDVNERLKSEPPAIQAASTQEPSAGEPNHSESTEDDLTTSDVHTIAAADKNALDHKADVQVKPQDVGTDSKGATIPKRKVPPAQAALAVMNSAALEDCDADKCSNLYDGMRTWLYGIQQLQLALAGQKHGLNEYIEQISSDADAFLRTPQSDTLSDAYKILTGNNRQVFAALRPFLVKMGDGSAIDTSDSSLPRQVRGLLCLESCEE